MLTFYGEEVSAPQRTAHDGWPPLVGCTRLLIQYIRGMHTVNLVPRAANRHCHCPRSLPKVSDERYDATRPHWTSWKYGCSSPSFPPHSTLSPFRLPPAVRKRRGSPQGGFGKLKRTSTVAPYSSSVLAETHTSYWGFCRKVTEHLQILIMIFVLVRAHLF